MTKRHGPEYVGGLLAGPVKSKKPDMTQKHTPGTYFAGARCVNKTGKHRKHRIAETFGLSLEEAQTWALRIAACLNGCTDIENPAAVPELVKAAEAAREYYSESFRICVLCAARRACKRLCAALAAVKAAPGRGGESLT